MCYRPKAVVVRTPQRRQRRVPFAKQRVRTRGVVERLTIGGIELEHTLENRVRFLFPAVSRISLGKPSRDDDVCRKFG